jgi:GTP-binding protein Era
MTAPPARRQVRPKSASVQSVDERLQTCGGGVPSSVRTGVIAVIGRPNAGKSSIVNALGGEKVAIVSPKPQTTRSAVEGVLNAVCGGRRVRAVLTDTPGIFKPRSVLDKYMSKSIRGAVSGADGILYVLDGAGAVTERDHALIGEYIKTGLPLVLAVNKCDLCTYETLYPKLAQLGAAADGAAAVITVSAAKKTNLDKLTAALADMLPAGGAETGEGMPVEPEAGANVSPRFKAAETVREKALLFLNDEIPHGIGVEITAYRDRKDGITDIFADIICEREGHKRIIIGAGGAMIKKIGSAARIDLERALVRKVNLQLYVKVRPDWRQSEAHVKDILRGA